MKVIWICYCKSITNLKCNSHKPEYPDMVPGLRLVRPGGGPEKTEKTPFPFLPGRVLPSQNVLPLCDQNFLPAQGVGYLTHYTKSLIQYLLHNFRRQQQCYGQFSKNQHLVHHPCNLDLRKMASTAELQSSCRDCKM